MTIDQLVEVIIAVCINMPFGGPRLDCQERMNNCAVGYGGQIMKASEFKAICLPLIKADMKATSIKEVKDE